MESPPLHFLTSETAATETDDIDDLGYYADGTKRTLTDDQVAIFRHSEIQAILRTQRLAQEAAETDDVPENDSAPVPEDAHMHKRESLRSESPGSENASNPAKRKWQHFINSSEENPGYLTHRRMARELDELQQESVDLLYGEEEPRLDLHRQSKANMSGKAVTEESAVVSNPGPGISLKQPAFQWPSLG